jgi:hypothetical protein
MFIEIIFCVSFTSVSIKVQMSDSDEDPEITSGLKKVVSMLLIVLIVILIFILINHFFVEYVCISFIHGLKPNS